MEEVVAFDCEVYRNYFLVSFKRESDGKVVSIDMFGKNKKLSDDQRESLKKTMICRHTFGFNSRNYDIPIVCAAIKGFTCTELKDLSDEIIKENQVGWITMDKYGLRLPSGAKSFDVSEPAPGVKVSLKLYGGRLHSQKLQDLPYEADTILTKEQAAEVKKYCVNDLDTTIDLFNHIKPRLELRTQMSEQYGQDLMSKSDAQIAEVVIKSEIQKLTERKIYKPDFDPKATFKYNPPSFIKFKTEQLQEAFELIKNTKFGLNASGNVELPKEIKSLKIKLGSSQYQLGIGGLHSKEKSQALEPTENELLIDADVASYYPSIILNEGLYPERLGPSFLKVYRKIVEERLEAKRNGDTVVNNSLKIVINGSFGKLGARYSALYSPDLMIAVTITGQLSLLMLIEQMELNNMSVFSANTDGFVTLCPKDRRKDYDKLCKQWEKTTGFVLEYNEYKALYSRDVNNYFAVTDYGTKNKGIFTFNEISKNPATEICAKAAMERLINGTPVSKTIKECTNIKEFLNVRTVNGGCTIGENGEYLGKVVRWIYSTEGYQLYYKKPNKHGTLNKVPKGNGARAIMDFDEFPTDIDYERYTKESIEILEDLGIFKDF
jgi:hypothetical protein